MHLAVNNKKAINQQNGQQGFLPQPIRADQPSQLIQWRDGTREYISNHRLSSLDGKTLMVDATA